MRRRRSGFCLQIVECSVLFATQTTYATGSSPYSVAAADVDGDNKPDIIVANYGSNTVECSSQHRQRHLCESNDLSHWHSAHTVCGSSRCQWRQQNRHYCRKLRIRPTSSVLLNTGNGTFATQKNYTTDNSPISVAAADVNGDNRPDIIVANEGSATVGVLLNTGNGTFATQTTYATGSGPQSRWQQPMSMVTTDPTLLSQTMVRTPSVFFSTQATAPLRIKRLIPLALTHTLWQQPMSMATTDPTLLSQTMRFEHRRCSSQHRQRHLCDSKELYN